MKNVAIVIINFNGVKDTIECLRSIDKLSIPADINLLTIIVDNGSEEEFKVQSFGKAQDKSSKFKVGELKVIRSDENLGFTGGNNLGIKYALEHGADYVLLLNNDTIVDKDLIKELLKAIESDNKIGIVVPKIYFAKGHEYHKDRYKKDELGKIIWYAGGTMDWNNMLGSHRGVDEVDTGQYNKTEKTEFATGCAMFIKKEVFEKVGLLNEKYFLYYEDADFSERIKKAGYKIIYAPSAILWHKNAGSAGGVGSKLQDYFITRNRLLFGIRYSPLRAKIALLRESFKLLINGRSWQKKGIIDFYIKKYGKGSFKDKN